MRRAQVRAERKKKKTIEQRPRKVRSERKNGKIFMLTFDMELNIVQLWWRGMARCALCPCPDENSDFHDLSISSSHRQPPRWCKHKYLLSPRSTICRSKRPRRIGKFSSLRLFTRNAVEGKVLLNRLRAVVNEAGRIRHNDRNIG